VSGALPTCSITPVRSRAAVLRGSAPKMLTTPELGELSPISSFTAVDLPAPFGPSSATTSPRPSVSERLFSATTPLL
jgi:hypothetical protein